MKEIYEMDVYKLAEKLSDMIWYAFDNWTVKVQKTIGYQIADYTKIIDELGPKLNAFIKSTK